MRHLELGRVVMPTTPLRLHGTDRVEAGPSPTIGQHNAEIYGGWLGLSAGEIAELRADPSRYGDELLDAHLSLSPNDSESLRSALGLAVEPGGEEFREKILPAPWPGAGVEGWEGGATTGDAIRSASTLT